VKRHLRRISSQGGIEGVSYFSFVYSHSHREAGRTASRLLLTLIFLKWKLSAYGNYSMQIQNVVSRDHKLVTLKKLKNEVIPW
jgi:hypothetical protein